MPDYGQFKARLDAVQPRHGWVRPPDADLAPRWALLREFQDEWGYPSEGARVWEKEDGGPREAKRQFFAELMGNLAAPAPPDLPIPAALSEWWDLPFNSFARNPRYYWTHPVWPPETPEKLLLPADHPMAAAGDRRLCVFMTEYQECNHWVYPAACASWPDPPVLVDARDGWVLQARTMSEFFLQIAVLRLTGALGWTVQSSAMHPDLRKWIPDESVLTDADVDTLTPRVRAELGPMGFLSWREMGADRVLYGGDDVIVGLDAQIDARPRLTVRARNLEALEALGRKLGFDLVARARPPHLGD